MKKKFKIGTIFSTILCLIAAFLFWFFVKYAALSASTVLNIFSF